jgi:uncharacterized protein YecE (DUF72 family)
MSLYLGAPVWALKDWVGNFFPPKSKAKDFLSLYASRLNAVEGNTTFYSLPNLDVLDKWVNDTPPGFRFCLKFPKLISHQLKLRNAEADTEAFINCLTVLDERAGPSFLQMPPTFAIGNLPVLTAYLDSLPREYEYAVEVRHPSFYTEPGEAALNEALHQRNVARCVFDTRNIEKMTDLKEEAVVKAREQKPRMPVRFTRTASFAFIRYLGYPNVSQNAQLLDEWAGYVSEWLTAGDDVFFFCHLPNDQQVPQLCRDFYARVSARHSLPPMPLWEDDAGSSHQLSLL